MDIEIFLSNFDKVKSTDNGKWIACCSAHLDKSPSLAIKQTDDGKILLHCFSGCQVSDIVAAVGLTLSDLMPEHSTYKKGTKPPRFNKYELFDRLVGPEYATGTTLLENQYPDDIKKLLTFSTTNGLQLPTVVQFQQRVFIKNLRRSNREFNAYPSVYGVKKF